ncbi:hypothetical protein [Nostoc linckia]|uniref:hypothetical protein n=1 Tax=Nostoc linckia TaxID=92942 RepID=UPI0015D4AEBB|nr:hypothetical protein [Nostoc linckia]
MNSKLAPFYTNCRAKRAIAFIHLKGVRSPVVEDAMPPAGYANATNFGTNL